MEKRKTELLYNGTIEVTFVEDKSVWPEIHEYRIRVKKGDKWGPEKKVDISVSGVTKVLDKPALVGWATKMCGEFVMLNNGRLAEKVVVATETGLRVDEVELDNFIKEMKGHGKGKKTEAATIGTMAHSWVEQHIKWVMGLGTKPEEVVNASVNNAIQAFLKWEKEHDVVYLATEKLVYSKKGKYAGQLDIEAKVDGELCILDNKTSSGIYLEMEYQTAGYQIAREEEGGKKYDARWILRLDKVTGEFEAKRFTDNADAKSGYLYCLGLSKLNLARVLKEKQAREERKTVKKANSKK